MASAYDQQFLQGIIFRLVGLVQVKLFDGADRIAANGSRLFVVQDCEVDSVSHEMKPDTGDNLAFKHIQRWFTQNSSPYQNFSQYFSGTYKT